jgi:WD40 repeat protein
VLVSSLTLSVPTRGSTKALMAVGKGSGCISAWEFDVSWCCTRIACQLKAHDQVVTGLTWGRDGRCLYSCGQDNHLKSWEFMGSELWGLPFPDCSALFVSETPQVSSDLPASALDPFYGVTLSPGCLAMAVVWFFVSLDYVPASVLDSHMLLHMVDLGFELCTSSSTNL